MSQTNQNAARKSNETPRTPAAPRSRRRGRRQGEGHSLEAQGEPLVWLNGAGLIICLTMVVGLLALVLYQGAIALWPARVVQVNTVTGDIHLGEVTRQSNYELTYNSLAAMSGASYDEAGKLLHPKFREKLAELLHDGRFGSRVESLDDAARKALSNMLALAPVVREASPTDREAFRKKIDEWLDERQSQRWEKLAADVKIAVDADDDGAALFALWTQWKAGEQAWVEQGQLSDLSDQLASDADPAYQSWANHLFSLLSIDISVTAHRRLIRTGNFDLTNEHFHWVSDFEVTEEENPRWAIVVERLTWGRFYGFPKSLTIDGEQVATDPDEIWTTFLREQPRVRQRWQQRRDLETDDTGAINRQLEDARLELKRVELKYGKDSPQWITAQEKHLEQEAGLNDLFATIRAEIKQLDEKNSGYQLVLETAQGEEKSLALADIVRAYPANQLGAGGKLSVYVARWVEFVSDDPREANSEGGVFPAIWGTVVMTLMMSLAVVPFGVLAALYLREYAKAGLIVSTVRIAVNNLAGVPSIVFGVFGLGFFCYIIGASLDQLFFQAKLPNPTFGTGGLMWASLTLALLTLPVVIVATEEALAAVPRSMREGSLACGATKWQTIRRIVLPRAMPGIMTGLILAMARGAGEVAPLMLVGAVKLAPELPVDGQFPYFHLQRSFMHLGFHIFDLGFQSQNSEAAKPMVFTTTLLLIAIIASMNVLAIWLRARLNRKFMGAQF